MSEQSLAPEQRSCVKQQDTGRLEQFLKASVEDTNHQKAVFTNSCHHWYVPGPGLFTPIPYC